MKPRVAPFEGGTWVSAVLALGLALTAGGCASQREDARARESERASEMASGDEGRRARSVERSTWERSRAEQEARYWEEKHRAR